MQPCCSTVVHVYVHTDVTLYATAAFTSVTAVITSNVYKYDTYTYIIDYISHGSISGNFSVCMHNYILYNIIIIYMHMNDNYNCYYYIIIYYETRLQRLMSNT